MNISTPTKTGYISLFPMFNILICTLGVMIFILIAVVTVSLGVGKTVTVIPGITNRHGVHQKTPVFVEWDGRNMIIHPLKQVIHFDKDLWDLGVFQNIYRYIDEKVRLSSLNKLFDGLHAKSDRYVVVLVRPSGFHNFLGVKGYFKAKGVKVGYEPVDQDCKIKVNGECYVREEQGKASY